MTKIPIVYEDDEIFLVNKPAGLSVQGGAGITRSLDEELAKQVGCKVHLVHRLDRETSGLLVVAKNSPAAKKWIGLIAGKQVKKEYTAICFGLPLVKGKPAKEGTITDSVTKQGREQSALTHFSVEDSVQIPLAESDGKDAEDSICLSRLHLVLGTGRMHQIRIHLARVHCPIVGDDKHGDFKLNKVAKRALKIKTLCLAATKITLPLGGKMRTFEVDLPEHMKFKSPEDQEKSAKQVVTVINNEPLFTIKWRLTSWCNYRCSYCIQDRLQHYDKEDRTDFDRLLSVAKDVNRFIEESPRPVKLVLLGGEVSYYDLEKLIDAIPSCKLKKVTVTTNFSKPLDYYLSFARCLRQRDITLEMCCSLHIEYVKPEEFIKKAAHLKKESGFDGIRIEYVVNRKTEAFVKEIQSLCKDYGLDYRFDYDKMESEEFRSHDLAVVCYKKSRYTVIFDDGSSDKTLSQNQLCNLQNGQSQNSKFKTEGFYCTIGQTYMYIDVDMAADHELCIPKEQFLPVSQYHVKTEARLCPHKSCYLCGDFSIARRKEALI